MSEKENPLLASLESDLADVRAFMKQFASHVIAQKVSAWPVFIAGIAPMTLGKPFIAGRQMGLNWDYNVSILEDFVNKGILLRNKVESFQHTWGDANSRLCIFIADEDHGGFVFVAADAPDVDPE